MATNPSFRGSIFVSYRRADAPGYVRGLMSDLRNVFGSHQVFLDMEDIEAGSDFPRIIDEAVSNCELLLVIMGSNWAELKTESGLRRIEDEKDYVRLEISSAINRKIPIIPVLVENAKMPKAEELPAEIVQLSTLQGIPLTHERWDDDITKLLTAIEKMTVEPRMARLYSAALAKLNEGEWQQALADFEAIAAVQPQYMGVSSRIVPLRQLAKKFSKLGAKASEWQNFAGSYPMLLLALVCLVPNGLAALFNYLFNWEVIVKPMINGSGDKAEQYFILCAGLVNSFGFLIGLLVFLYLAKPIGEGLAAIASEKNLPFAELTAIRRRCLNLGQHAAIIGTCLWIIAGPIYPLTISTLEISYYLYFIASLTLCGVFVATYSFLFVTWLCTHVYFPTFISPGSVTVDDIDLLAKVDSLRWRYLAMAGTLPMLVLAFGVVLSTTIKSQVVTLLLGVFGFVGVLGFVLALRLFQVIQTDIALLIEASSASSRTSPQIKQFS